MYHSNKNATKNIIVTDFNLLQDHPEKGKIFTQPTLIAFKREKNPANFLVKNSLKSSLQTLGQLALKPNRETVRRLDLRELLTLKLPGEYF